MRSILITPPILITGAAFATSAAAQQLPPARESGAYCVAGEDTWTLAIPRAPNQGCRVGWVGHGAYRSRKADRR
jgi:hypothetical protein